VIPPGLAGTPQTIMRTNNTWADNFESFQINFLKVSDQTFGEFKKFLTQLGFHNGVVRLTDLTCEKDDRQDIFASVEN